MTTPMSELSSIFKQIPSIVKSEVERSLSYLGEQCVTKVRDRTFDESWIDHTGNLRSSIGYAIYDYGKKVIESAFPVVREGSEGQSEGRKYIAELASQYSKVYALVVVAAMSYAEYVEAIKGKDVLASTEVWAKNTVNSYIEQAKIRAEKRIQKLIA